MNQKATLSVLDGGADQAPVNNEPSPDPCDRGYRRLVWTARITISIFSAILIIADAMYGSGWLSVALALSTATLAAFNPSTAVCVFLFALPFFGNRPGTEQVHLLLLAASGFAIGAPWGLRHSASRKTNEAPNLISFLAHLYVFVSALSLVALPWKMMLHDASARISELSISSVLISITYFATRAENHLGYSALSVLLSAYCVMLMHVIYLLGREHSERLVAFCWAALAGLLTTFTIGFFNYYGLLDLSSLRALDPIANPGGIQFRMQSVFGHSGWFAEYVTLAVPFVLVVLLLKRSFSSRLALILGCAVLGELVLILTYQRGGWISYPLTLVIVWAAIYVTRKIEQYPDANHVLAIREALRSSAMKVALCVPITVLISIGILFAIGVSDKNDPGELVSKYTERFKSIQQASDRTEFFEAGLKIGLLHPFFGAGSESFHAQFEKEFESPKGHFYKQLDLPLHGSAHNVYMQTFSGKGFVGLTILAWLIAACCFYGLKTALTNRNIDYARRITTVIAVSSCLAFLIYGNVQEIFYVQSLQFLFFAAVGIAAAGTYPHVIASEGTRRSAVLMLAVFFAAHLAWEFAYPGSARVALSEPSDYGCYGKEVDENGGRFSWCGTRVERPFLVTTHNGEKVVRFSLKTFILTQNASIEFLSVEANGQEIKKVRLLPLTSYPITVRIPAEKYSLIQDGNIRLKLITSNLFVPVRDIPNNPDLRALSYKLYDQGQYPESYN